MAKKSVDTEEVTEAVEELPQVEAPTAKAKKPAKTKQEPTLSATEVAEACLKKSIKWGSGRERDELVKKAGLDPAEVRSEIARLRGEQLVNN